MLQMLLLNGIRQSKGGQTRIPGRQTDRGPKLGHQGVPVGNQKSLKSQTLAPSLKMMTKKSPTCFDNLITLNDYTLVTVFIRFEASQPLLTKTGDCSICYVCEKLE